MRVALAGAVVVIVAWTALHRARRPAEEPSAAGSSSAPADGSAAGATPAPVAGEAAAPADLSGAVDARPPDPEPSRIPEGPPAATGILGLDERADRAPARHGAVRAMAVLVILLACAAIALALAAPATSRGHSDPPARRSGDVRHSTDPPRAETVRSIAPTAGSKSVVPDTPIVVTFWSPLAPGSPRPSLRPAVAGTWQVVGTAELLFTPRASFVPQTTYTVTIPGGSAGVRARGGAALAHSIKWSFTIKPGSVLRAQQLLAKLGYLPLSFSGSTPAPAAMATVQPGSFAWRDQGFPASYTSLWSPTRFTALTRGAVMAFETQNGLEDAGTTGPAFWTALLADAAAGKKDAEPVTYVLVTKNLPEHLTIWVNGVLTFSHVPCNTGVAGAPTTDGTYQVFEHVEVSNMQGTDVTGTSYDVTVPWASYFNGGEALHGYPRAAYGFPQSNGCVEMPITTAGRVWPSTPIGTLVTVVGPTA